MYSVRHPARRYDREYIAYPISVFSLCVAGLICRCGSVGKHGGFCFFSFPAVSMISCPHPPDPLPRRGRGSLKVYFAGGFAPGTPALNRLRHLQTPPCRSPAVVCPAGRRVDEHWRYPAGGLPGRSAARPALSFICCPHPPFPLRGRGSLKVYFAGGSAPGTPALNRLRHMQTLPYRCPAGGLPGRSAARPAFSFDSAPIPPPPFPSGRRSLKVYFAGGLRPRHPCTEPSTALAETAMQVPGGWLARQVGGTPCL